MAAITRGISRMNSKTININARYYLEPTVTGPAGTWNVVDRARQLRHDALTLIFCNGTDQECRDWITRNCDEPTEHAPGPFGSHEHGPGGQEQNINPRIDIIAADGTIITDLTLSFTDEQHNAEQRANAALFMASADMLALLEQYHASMPTRESGALIAKARGWT